MIEVFIGFAGVLIGGLITYDRDRRSWLRDRRQAAYYQFISAADTYVRAGRHRYKALQRTRLAVATSASEDAKKAFRRSFEDLEKAFQTLHLIASSRMLSRADEFFYIAAVSFPDEDAYSDDNAFIRLWDEYYDLLWDESDGALIYLTRRELGSLNLFDKIRHARWSLRQRLNTARWRRQAKRARRDELAASETASETASEPGA